MTIDIVRGDATSLIFDITEAYDADGNPISDLGGYQARLHARNRIDDAVPVFQKSTSAGSISISGLQVVVKLDPADTAGLPADTVLLADLELLSPGGKPATVTIAGSKSHLFRLRVVGDVTR